MNDVRRCDARGTIGYAGTEALCNGRVRIRAPARSTAFWWSSGGTAVLPRAFGSDCSKARQFRCSYAAIPVEREAQRARRLRAASVASSHVVHGFQHDVMSHLMNSAPAPPQM